MSGFASGIANQAVGSNDLRSRYLGGYATWTGDSGWYADAVLQAGRHRYRVQPEPGPGTSAKGSSLTGVDRSRQGVRAGRPRNWKVEPQRAAGAPAPEPGRQHHLRRAWSSRTPHSGWIARAGVRVKGEFATGAGLLQPYARLNVYRTSSGNDVARFIGPAGATDIASARAAAPRSWPAASRWRWASAPASTARSGKLWASGGDARVRSGVQGSVGLRVRW